MKTLLLAAAGVAVAGSSAALAQTPPQGGRGDGVQTRAEVVQHVERLFARLDGNRDGFITQAEAQAAQGQLRQRAPRAGNADRQGQRAARRFDRIDTNNDGAISPAELAAGQAARGQNGERLGGRRGGMNLAGRMFALADANRDNRVSLAEARAAALQHFDRADLNRDGRVTREERQQLRGQFRGQAPVRG